MQVMAANDFPLGRGCFTPLWFCAVALSKISLSAVSPEHFVWSYLCGALISNILKDPHASGFCCGSSVCVVWRNPFASI